MKKRLINLSFILLPLLFSACSFGPDFEVPETETPDHFKSAELKPDSTVNLEWWNLFNDPVLDTLVIYALSNNKDVLIAASRIEEARAALGFTRADQYPKLDIQASATRGDMLQRLKLDEEMNNYYIAPVVSWELDFWGKFRKASEAAQADFIASQYLQRSFQISLITEVVGTYFTFLDYKNRLNISRKTLELREESLHIIQRRFDEGVIPEIDLHQAIIQREIAAGAIPVFKRSLAKTENALSVLLGKMPESFDFSSELDSSFSAPVIPAGLPSQLLERRPDIAEARFRLKAQTAQVGVAEALRFPTISLTGILGFASADLNTLTDDPGWSASATLFGPLFNFNKNTRRVEVEEERMRQSALAYENTVLQAFREVEDVLIEVQTFQEELAAKTRQLNSAASAAGLSKQRYDKGVASYLEVLETERSLFDVELQRSTLEKEYYNSFIRLYKALGGGWITKEHSDQEKLPQED